MEAGAVLFLCAFYVIYKMLPAGIKPWFVLGSIIFSIWLIWPSSREVPKDYYYVPDLFGGYYSEIFQSKPNQTPTEINWFAVPLLFVPILYPGIPIFLEIRRWIQDRRRRKEFKKFLKNRS